jgi:hypothetical protein
MIDHRGHSDITAKAVLVLVALTAPAIRTTAAFYATADGGYRS